MKQRQRIMASNNHNPIIKDVGRGYAFYYCHYLLPLLHTASCFSCHISLALSAYRTLNFKFMQYTKTFNESRYQYAHSLSTERVTVVLFPFVKCKKHFIKMFPDVGMVCKK